jgi:uncharacterized protein YktB (UPF0637 family)
MEQIKEAVIAGAIPVVVTLIGWALSMLRSWLQAKIANEYAQRIAAEAFQVVGAVAQAIGDDLKESAKDGKLSEEEKQRLKRLALETLKERLRDVPKHLFPDLEARMSDAIEAAVNGKK